MIRGWDQWTRKDSRNSRGTELPVVKSSCLFLGRIACASVPRGVSGGFRGEQVTRGGDGREVMAIYEGSRGEVTFDLGLSLVKYSCENPTRCDRGCARKGDQRNQRNPLSVCASSWTVNEYSAPSFVVFLLLFSFFFHSSPNFLPHSVGDRIGKEQFEFLEIELDTRLIAGCVSEGFFLSYGSNRNVQHQEYRCAMLPSLNFLIGLVLDWLSDLGRIYDCVITFLFN